PSIPYPPGSPPFPYTTLFRGGSRPADVPARVGDPRHRRRLRSLARAGARPAARHLLDDARRPGDVADAGRGARTGPRAGGDALGGRGRRPVQRHPRASRHDPGEPGDHAGGVRGGAGHARSCARRVPLRLLPLPREGVDAVVQRIIAAARDCEDEELLVAAMVRAGQLDQAEAVLKEKIWDLLPNAMAPLWTALEQLSPRALVERRALLSARLRLSASRHRGPVSTRAARSTRRTSWGCDPRAMGAPRAPCPAHGPPLPPRVGRVPDGTGVGMDI